MSVTLITGASSGIGRSLGRRLALAGNSVVAVARRLPLLESLVAEISAGGGRAVAVAADVTQKPEIRAAVHAGEQSFGPIDRLIVNAGGGDRTRIDDFNSDHVERAVALNLYGAVYAIEAVLPAMLARRSGHLVLMGSLAGLRGLPAAGAYCAAKAGLIALAESLRIELRPRGIDVTLLLPGFIRTDPTKMRNKPFVLELEDATARMQRAIEARKARYAFPFPLAAVMTVAPVLPVAVYDRLVGLIAR